MKPQSQIFDLQKTQEVLFCAEFINS